MLYINNDEPRQEAQDLAVDSAKILPHLVKRTRIRLGRRNAPYPGRPTLGSVKDTYHKPDGPYYKTPRVAVGWPPDLFEKIRDLAAANEISFAEQTRQLVLIGLDALEAEGRARNGPRSATGSQGSQEQHQAATTPPENNNSRHGASGGAK